MLDLKPFPSMSDGSQQQILVVEDEAPLRLLLSSLLAPLNVAVTVAATAAEALGQIEQGLRPSLVITDVLMPGTSGTVLAEQLLALDGEMSVLLISADASRPGISELMRLQRVRFLEKPFSTGELLKEIDLLLSPEA